MTRVLRIGDVQADETEAADRRLPEFSYPRLLRDRLGNRVARSQEPLPCFAETGCAALRSRAG
jgi:hypothetical protein